MTRVMFAVVLTFAFENDGEKNKIDEVHCINTFKSILFLVMHHNFSVKSQN